MKRLITMLTVLTLLLTACSMPNAATNDQANTTEPPQVEAGSGNAETTAEAEPPGRRAGRQRMNRRALPGLS